MKNFNIVKQYSGVALILIGLLGGCLAILFTLGVEFSSVSRFASGNRVFGMTGGASNTPFLFGMLAISGAWLLVSVKSE